MYNMKKPSNISNQILKAHLKLDKIVSFSLID
jgi:hypothetical protein